MTTKAEGESDVLKAVLQILLPHCLWISRVNGGSFIMHGRGSNRMFSAYRLYRPEVSGEDKSIRLPDLMGQLRDGRILAVECKAVGGTVTDAQTAFLALVQKTGGVAGICYDADDAKALVAEILDDLESVPANATYRLPMDEVA